VNVHTGFCCLAHAGIEVSSHDPLSFLRGCRARIPPKSEVKKLQSRSYGDVELSSKVIHKGMQS
jgi:hypothetical protein